MKAILFDLDGTLIDSGGDIATAANKVVHALGRAELPESVIRGYVGDGVVNLMRRCLGTDEEGVVKDAVERFHEAYDACCLDQTRLYPGIKEMLAELEGTRLAVVSNKPERHCRRILEGLGVGRHFQVIAGGETFPEKKPSPVPILCILRRFDAAPNRTVVVGDGIQDLRAARAAGIPSCAVLWGFTSRERLEAESPDHVVETVAGLRELLV